MTHWFERLHSEKPTNFYNLMSQNMSGQELPRLYDPAWVHVKTLTTELSECDPSPTPTPTLATVTATLSLVEYLTQGVLLLHEQYWSPEKVCQSAHHSPQTTVM